MKKSGTSNPYRFRELDALRGIAALWVLLFHYLVQYDVLYGKDMIPLFADLHFPNGIYGVYLFFMISGFVIFMTLQGCKSALDFVVSRFSRLFPAYWAGVLATSAIAFFAPLPGQSVSLGNVLANMTMVHGFFYVNNIDGVYWTLLFELSFYAIMLALFSSRLLPRIELVCWVWLCAAAAIVFAARHGFELLPFRLTVLLVIPYIQFFVAGIVFYLVRTEGYTANRLCLLGACIFVEQFEDDLISAMIALGFILIFHFCATGSLRRLAVGPLLWLGAISYPLYLTHQMIGYRAIEAMLGWRLPRIVALPLAIAVALALAWVISIGVERPAMRAIRQWYWLQKRKYARGIEAATLAHGEPN